MQDMGGKGGKLGMNSGCGETGTDLFQLFKQNGLFLLAFLSQGFSV